MGREPQSSHLFFLSLEEHDKDEEPIRDMDINRFFTDTLNVVKKHSPEILTALGVGGVVTTSYLVGRASFEAAGKMESIAPDTPVKERVKLVWKCYIPAAVSGAVTVGCIIGASRTSSRRTAVAVTAYSISEKAFTEYRDKVVENIGQSKEQKVRDEIAQDRVSENPPKTDLVILGKGHVLCCELYTMRYFRSDMETLMKVQNAINHLINTSIMFVTLSEFYDALGLDHTSESSEVGWDSERGLMELEFSTVKAPNDEPALAFSYNYIKLL